MTAFTPQDFGAVIPGFVGATATGTTLGTATLLTAQAMVFTQVSSGGMAQLPSANASMIVLMVFNQGANPLVIAPQLGGRIDALNVNATITISVGGMMFFWCFDPPLGSGVNWFSSSGLLGAGSNLSGLPKSNAGLAAGSPWNNGGVVCVA